MDQGGGKGGEFRFPADEMAGFPGEAHDRSAGPPRRLVRHQCTQLTIRAERLVVNLGDAPVHPDPAVLHLAEIPLGEMGGNRQCGQ
jgi:hypothetical protein